MRLWICKPRNCYTEAKVNVCSVNCKQQDPGSYLNCEPGAPSASIILLDILINNKLNAWKELLREDLVAYDWVAQRSYAFNGNFYDVSWHHGANAFGGAGAE
jgi:hypothetical protein